jgi:Flp pilus assembly protein TadD
MYGVLLILALTVPVATSAESDSLTWYIEQGRAHIQKHHYQEAYDAYLAVLRLDPQSLEAYRFLGIASSSLGRHEEARSHLEKAYRLNPKDADICNNLGAVHANLGQSAQAVRFYLEALKIDTADAVLMTNLGKEYLKLGELGKAIPVLRRAFGLEPEKPLIAFLLANSFAGSESYDSAEYYYQRALDNKGGDPELHYRLGAVKRELGKTAEAIDQFQRSLVLRPQQRDCRQALAMLLIQQGRYAEASDHFQAALAADSSYTPAMVGYGASLYLNGQSAMAEGILDRLNEVDSTLGRQMLQLVDEERARSRGAGSQ